MAGHMKSPRGLHAACTAGWTALIYSILFTVARGHERSHAANSGKIMTF